MYKDSDSQFLRTTIGLLSELVAIEESVPIVTLKENVRSFQNLKQHKYLIKYYIIQKFSFKSFLMLQLKCCFTFKNIPTCSFKYFESSEFIVVKKKSLLKVH